MPNLSQSFDGSLNNMSNLPSGYTVHSIIGDGNCMFRAMSYGLYGTQDRHAEIRREVVTHVMDNWSHFGRFVIGDNSYGPTMRSPTDYARHMSRNGAQGGHVELVAAANVYNVNIAVHNTRDHRVIQIPASGSSRRHIALLYSGSGDSGHYEAIGVKR